LEKCFFAYNPGLKRRFPFRYTIDGYQPNELRDIFLKKIGDSKWKIKEEDINKEALSTFFTEHKDNLPYFGGDIENLLMDCKFMHSRRVVGKHPKLRRNLVKEDIEAGLKRFKKNMARKSGDIYLEFLTEIVEPSDNQQDVINIKELYKFFKDWYSESYAAGHTTTKDLSRKEFTNYMEETDFLIEKGIIQGVKLVKDEMKQYLHNTIYM
jgi:SpoVK/Ycf46/Vps4 family AAA+-type ATPase